LTVGTRALKLFLLVLEKIIQYLFPLYHNITGKISDEINVDPLREPAQEDQQRTLRRPTMLLARLLATHVRETVERGVARLRVRIKYWRRWGCTLEILGHGFDS
jgi:hypothetical protein